MQHKWLLTFDAQIPIQLRRLPSKDRLAVFHSIATLLSAENPSAVVGVKKLVEKRFEGMWRQRQGDYRIFFTLEAGEILHFEHHYKGKLHLVSVVHRSDAY